MYIPNFYNQENIETLLQFMRQFSFATLISSENNFPNATHLPFLINNEEDGKIILQTHIARTNPHWKTWMDGTETLVIFQGPHAYISPSLYISHQNVPTWNYIAVHAYGKVKTITEPDELLSLLEKTISTFEEAYMQQWKELSGKYISGMLNAIVGLEITVEKLQGKFKLSQNKPRTDRQNIIDKLSASSFTNEQQIATYMEQMEAK